MISNNPLLLHNQDHQAKHSDILAAARSAAVTSPPIWWRTCAFDNFGGVAYERPAPSAPAPIHSKFDLNQQFKSLDQLLKNYGMADAPIGYEQAQARADAAIAKMRADAIRTQERKAAIAKMRSWRG